MVLGVWNQCHVAVWGPGVEVQLNPYSRNGSLSLRVLMDMDLNFKNLESFAVLSGIDTNAGELLRIERSESSRDISRRGRGRGGDE